MSRGENFQKCGKYRNGHCTRTSTSACRDLNTKRTILKLHDMYQNQKCKCQK